MHTSRSHWAFINILRSQGNCSSLIPGLSLPKNWTNTLYIPNDFFKKFTYGILNFLKVTNAFFSVRYFWFCSNFNDDATLYCSNNCSWYFLSIILNFAIEAQCLEFVSNSSWLSNMSITYIVVWYLLQLWHWVWTWSYWADKWIYFIDLQSRKKLQWNFCWLFPKAEANFGFGTNWQRNGVRIWGQILCDKKVVAFI